MDLISCHDRIQHLGLLSWAACGKDPGTNPSMILNEAGRSGRYTQAEMDSLSFDGSAPDAAALSARWKAMLAEARDVIAALPPAEVGTCVLDAVGGLYRGNPGSLAEALGRESLRFHGEASADRSQSSSIGNRQAVEEIRLERVSWCSKKLRRLCRNSAATRWMTGARERKRLQALGGLYDLRTLWAFRKGFVHIHVHGDRSRAVPEVLRDGLYGCTVADCQSGKAVAHAVSRDSAPEDVACRLS